MTDYISREAAIEFIDAGHLVSGNEPRWSDNEVVNFLKSRPAADVVEQKWIPCSERLPEKNSEYLVTKVDNITDDLLLDIAYYGDWIQNNNGFYKADEVIAWMPLPEPYKGEQE